MKSINSAFRLSVLLLLSVFVSPALPQSQSSSNDARLSGILTDPSGASVGDVRVTAKPQGTGATRVWVAVSSSDGSYALIVPPGRYLLRFVSDSFSPREISVELQPGESRSLSVRLDLALLSSNVLVTAQSEPIPVQLSPAPSSAVTREEIDQRQSVFIPDLLSFSPGVNFARNGANGALTSLFLDGGNSNFTKVLVDGSPINPPGGAVDFSLLTTDNIDKVEIVRGAESAIYGTDAVSGVVQLFTHRGDTTVPAFSVFSEGGSYSTARGGAQFSGLLGKFDYSVAASYFETGGEFPNSDYINRTFSSNFGYSFSDTNQIHLALRNNSGDAGTPGQIDYTPPSLYQRYNQELFSTNLRWDFVLGKHWHNELMGAESYTRQHSFNNQQSFYATDPNVFCPQANPASVATAEFCDYLYDDKYQYNRASFTAQTSYIARIFAATAGYQYEVENGAISYLEQPHVRRNNQAGFLDFRYSPISRLSLNAALRAEDNGYFGTRVVPRAGATYALRYAKGFFGDTTLRAYYGQGIKEPRFDQTYGTDPCDPGNLSLKPEASKNWSAGFDQKLADDRIKLSAEYFSNRFYDIVSFQEGTIPTPSCPYGLGTYFNTDLARARGISLTAQAHATRWLLVTGNYMYDDSRVIASPNATDPAEIPGNRLIRRPLHSGSITFAGTFHRFNATFAGYFTGQTTDSDFLGLGYTRNAGYARFDLSASYLFYRGFSIYARATNLFDKQYQYALGYPALGRQGIIGLRYQFAGHN
jgi:outer membrane cobalamin receptor